MADCVSEDFAVAGLCGEFNELPSSRLLLEHASGDDLRSARRVGHRSTLGTCA